MSQMTCKKMTIIALAGVSVQTIGLALFVFGFFPVKPALSGVSGPESYRAPASDFNENHINISLPPRQVRSLYQELSGIRPLYDRLILMVIDGLPAEFVLGKDGKPPRKAFMEAMPYTQSLLANGMALGYHAKAAPPTVTMPRLKAMVSGAIGGFLDVAFNFNTQAMLDDNLLGQFLSIGWKMVMHGDETWLKLFPGLFTRHDGVSSFFVKDTVQVDQNVTRHLGDEFSRDDWNLLILHYLGLDHVGHIGGRNSLLMSPKLAEMDEIVKMIHSSFLTQEDYQRTLLVVVSDHGMTENGNHGGSSFEETDSLALFVGLRGHASDYTSATENTVQQVDIAPTLALLFGVPIPKNNVGVVISKTFDALKDDHQLRALELNSWQLFRLLEAQISGLSCANIPLNGFSDGRTSGTTECNGSIEKMLCCLYMNAAVLHSSWKSNKVSQSSSWEDYDNTVAAYHNFLKTASEWLSSRCTDKPVDLLAFGVAALLLSCVILLSLILHMCREDNLVEKLHHCHSNNDMRRWYLDEIFVLGAIFILVFSMLSSSMVEEEHYIWHFMTSTLFMILLRKTVQLLPERNSLSKGQNTNCKLQMCSVFVLLVSGRILRGWHQGGVNWTYLPDISKWLENAGSDYVKTVQLVSGVSVMCLGFYALSLLSLKKNVVLLVGFNFLVSGLSVLLHIMKYREDAFGTSNYGATTLAQMIYAVLGSTTVSIVVFLPWSMPIQISKVCSSHNIYSSTSVPGDVKDKSPLMELRNSLYLIGWAYIFCWCLLQLLLQQPINAMPMLLLLVQIVTSLLHFSYGGQHHKEWVEICALYFLGMTGHFALGNSNTLATIDVAGAFIGISSHSTLLSGILMFMITYASPLLVLLSMVIYMSVKNCLVTPQNLESGNLLKTMLGFPCLVPLSLNSILLTAYTLVLLLMRNHLFVWSVFSPKYLYVCATTFCIYIGVFVVAATGTYTFVVLDKRKLMQVSIVNDKR